MALHNITSIVKDLPANVIADLKAQWLIWEIDEDGNAWANGRKDEAKIEAIAQEYKAKREDAQADTATGIWRNINGAWLVETDAKVGQRVRVTRRDGSSSIHWVHAIIDGFAQVRDYAPATQAQSEQTEATAAPARRSCELCGSHTRVHRVTDMSGIPGWACYRCDDGAVSFA